MSLNLNKVRNVFLNEQHLLRALDYKYHNFRNDRKFRMSDPLLFLQRGAILLSGHAPIIKITLWGLSTPKNAPWLGAIYPQKRCTFANVVGSCAINVPPTCLQSRPTHPVKSAFYTILLRFSWDIGIYFLTTPLTAISSRRLGDVRAKASKSRREGGLCACPPVCDVMAQ